jgi:spoIIIJ-associated protein
MSENSGQTTLEIIAQSIEEAIQQGLDQLGLTEDEVEVEILDRGNKGLFGLGNRQARVRLTVGRTELPKPAIITSPVDNHLGDLQPDEDLEADEDEEPVLPDYSVDEINLTADEQRMVKVARSTVMDLLERMKVNATVTAMFIQPEVEGQRPTIWVDVNGNDLSILIGRHSQTLHALQYITSLIVGKELGRSVPLVIDVEGYRSRRQAQLRRLARTMAEQAVKTGRRQALEPMPANERRIVHMELRNFPGVITESIGEDPHRKVTIIPEA